MNQTNDELKKNVDGGDEQFQDDISQLKDTVYSSIYTDIAFCTSIILIISDLCPDSKIIMGFTAMLLMFILSIYLPRNAKKRIESNISISKDTQSIKIIKYATNIGYVSPFVCAGTWALTLEDIDCVWKFALIMMILAVVAVVSLTSFFNKSKKN